MVQLQLLRKRGTDLRKWQEIVFNGATNLAIALVVAGVYLFGYSVIHAKHIEEDE